VDQGHYETQCVEQVCYSSGGKRRGLFGCCKKNKGCDSGCGPTVVTVQKQVWVAQPVTRTEKVQVSKCVPSEEEYEYVEVSHKPVTKTVMEKVTTYNEVKKTRPVTYNVCKPVTKTEMVKVTSYTQVKKTRPVTYNVCKPVTKTENRTYTTYKSVPVTKEVMVNVCKPVSVEKTVNVRVCRHVTRQIEVKKPIYAPVVSVCTPDCAPAPKCCK
jgi:hypothetical protein